MFVYRVQKKQGSEEQGSKEGFGLIPIGIGDLAFQSHIHGLIYWGIFITDLEKRANLQTLGRFRGQ